jgi:hypothetical protein
MLSSLGTFPVPRVVIEITKNTFYSISWMMCLPLSIHFLGGMAQA